MGEFHQGSTTAIHTVGSKVETRLVECEKAIKREQHRRSAFNEAGEKVKKVITDLRLEVARSKVTESRAFEIDKWLRKVGSEIFNLLQDTEQEIQKKSGARDALQETVNSLKKMFDDIQRKSIEIDEWEARPDKTIEDMKERPVGAEVGPDVLKNARKKETRVPDESEVKPKRSRQRKPKVLEENKTGTSGVKPTRSERKKKEDQIVENGIKPMSRESSIVVIDSGPIE